MIKAWRMISTKGRISEAEVEEEKKGGFDKSVKRQPGN